MRLEGKVCLVTGAARRIGREIARGLAAGGADIAVHYRRSRRQAAELAALVRRESGVRAELFQADLEAPAQVRRLAERVLRVFKRADVLVNNASFYERTPVRAVKPSDFHRNLAVHAVAPFLLARSLAPSMRKAGMGKVVNIADWSARTPYTDYLPYSASKAALLSLNAGLAKELAPEIHVNAVLPGSMLLPEGAPRSLRKAAARAALLRRMGTPEDVVEAVLYLVDCDFVTGTELYVDGGRRLR